MINLRILTVCFLMGLMISCNLSHKKKDSKTLIAFGSCSRQYNPNQRWHDVMKNNPDIWIWLGDNIYGDTHDMELMAEKYKHQKSDSGYQLLLNSQTEIIGTWDDHDYGVNDGGIHFSKKDESKELFLDFLDIDEDNPVVNRDGVYQSYDYEFGENILKIILLDTRYFRDTIYRDPVTKAYLPNETGDVLGEAQWKWLEEELQSSNAELNIIGSSIQVIPKEQNYEKWANLPMAQIRLFELLQKYPDKKAVFLSGDRHIAEISQLNIEGLDYPLYDFTSSGLTHTWAQEEPEPNQYRISDFVVALNYGIIIIDWDANGKHRVTFQLKGEEDKLLYEFSPDYF